MKKPQHLDIIPYRPSYETSLGHPQASLAEALTMAGFMLQQQGVESC